MAQTTLDQRMLGVGTALTDHTITASDVITFADVGDSNLTKKDTVQGVLDLASGGKVLQVLTATKTDTASTTSTSMGDTGLSVAITPASSSNKVLVTAMINYGQNGAAANTFFNVVRGSTALLIGDAASSRTRCTISATDVGAGNAGTATPIILDSPSTASEVTYKIQWQVQSGTTAYINREHGDSDDSNATRMGSSIIVMEISA